MKTEREKQLGMAHLEGLVYQWHYLCNDGESFVCIAPTEDAAFRVLNAERPGMGADFVKCINLDYDCAHNLGYCEDCI